MDVSTNPLWEDVQAMLSDKERSILYRWRAEILIDDEVINPFRLDALSVRRQYNVNFGDEIYLTTQILAGDYHRRIIPNRDSIKVVLYKEPLDPITSAMVVDKEVSRRVYRALVLNPTSAAMESTHPGYTDQAVANEMLPEQVEMQLLDLAVEELRMVSSCGIYRKMRPHEVIQGALTLAAGQLNLEIDEGLRGIDVVPGNNQDVREHTVIPYGTRVRDIPRVLQDDVCGVYSSGLGHYIQNGLWYVFPKYNLKRFDETPSNLTVINIPQKRLPGAERTHKTVGDSTIILATGQTRHVDNSEDKQLNLGNGVRFAHADTMIDAFRTVSANRVTIAKQNNVSEWVLANRRSGMNLVNVSPRRITANHYRELSDLSERVGTYVQLEWQHADPDLIYPGMPVRYTYMDNDTLQTLEGLVLGSDYGVDLVSKGAAETRYACVVVLTLYLQQPKAD